MGVEEAVLQELLRSWEAKVAVSRVADFSQDSRMGPLAQQFPMLPNNPLGSGIIPPVAVARPTVTKDAKDGNAVAGGSKSNGKSVATEGSPSEKKEGDENEDEINSDLDDPEEEIDADDDEPGADSGDLVIALYEKVQRVKNKWKVTLKDGLISVGGKEYLFAKCSGEFEW